MSEAHANFHSANGRRHVLIVEDEPISRDILAFIVGEDYEVITAADGETALRLAWDHCDTLSLVLLDLMMPGVSGQEVLRRMKESPELRRIPVIVTSADVTQEIRCLDMGATDFIQKPYPEPGVVLARIRRTIQLTEDRQIIQSTERDPKTGLYNQEYFYSYAEKYDQYHRTTLTDAIVVDINHFSLVNKRFGRAYADEVLARIANAMRELVNGADGIVARSGADVFLLYCPHRDDYKTMLDVLSAKATEGQSGSRPIRLRMGVYAHVDKGLDVERRFERAKMAADTVRDSYTRSIGVYDDGLLKSELFSHRLLDDFAAALEQRQFVVYYQPKFDIRGQEPRLCGAEALVRWNHPELGLVRPGVFIQLFENNGLIQQLDRYVWRQTAKQVSAWLRDMGWCVPVSVNVSRADMYDPAVADELEQILDEFGLDAGALHLEVSESAYAEDPKQIIEMVGRLRGMGFVIEMDDFGMGYSSLDMLPSLPIDVLKLDMRLLRTAFSKDGERGMQMLGAVVDIARRLSAPIVVEGVESQEQLNTLRMLGCDAVQGFLLSEPVLAEAFEPLLVRGDARKDASAVDDAAEPRAATDESSEAEPHEGLWGRLPDVSLHSAEIVVVVLSALVAVVLVFAMSVVWQRRKNVEQANERYILAQRAATDLEMGSDYLTENVRSFVMTGDLVYLRNYFEEIEVDQRRFQAVHDMEELLAGDKENDALESLSTALRYSNELVVLEDQAMKLRLLADGVNPADMPAQVRDVRLQPEQEGLSDEERQSAAEELVFGRTYAKYKEAIRKNADTSAELLLQSSGELRTSASDEMRVMLVVEYACTGAMFALVVVDVLFMALWVRLPLGRMVKKMRSRELVTPAGVKELKIVSETYNTVFEDNRKQFDRLNYRSMHDALTGLFNRKAYELMSRELDLSRVALLMVDVDKFKTINDTYGHDVGDLVLMRVAEVLGYCFRSTDLVFRLGGDEFVVIMSNVDSSLSETVRRKIEQANVMLQKPTDDLPPTSLSVGVAFADRENPEGDIFKDADTALYRMKQSGRCGCVVF